MAELRLEPRALGGNFCRFGALPKGLLFSETSGRPCVPQRLEFSLGKDKTEEVRFPALLWLCVAMRVVERS